MTVWQESGEGRAASARRLVPTEPSLALNRLADLAASLVGASSAQVSLISTEQYVAAGTGAAAASVGRTSPAPDSLCTLTVANEATLAIQDAVNDDRVASLPPVASGVVGSYLGVPLKASDGEIVGALCVFDPSSRVWLPSEVDLLERLVPAVVTELELGALNAELDASRVIWQLAVDAAGVGAFDWDLTTGDLRWDARLLELFGTTAEEFGGTIEAFNEMVHPDDRARVTRALTAAIDTCGDYEAEYRVRTPSGGIRWIMAKGRALCDPNGVANRVLGAASDTTEVREGEARVSRVLEAMPTAFFQLDTSWRFTYVNGEAERLLGASRRALVGQVVWDLFPAAVGSDFETGYRGAVETGRPAVFDAYYPAPLDTWYQVHAWPHPNGLFVYFVDVTQRRAAAERLERSASRAALTARVTGSLIGAHDVVDGVAHLAGHLVPELADWCIVTVVEDNGWHPDWRRWLRDVSWTHADERLRPVLDRYAATRMPALTDDSPLPAALASTDPVLIVSSAADEIARTMHPGTARDLLAELDPGSALVVQLRGRGRVAGVLSLFRDRGRATFDDDEVATVVDIAVRAGLSLDTARQNASQRDLAEALQRSLLTEPPQPDGLEIAVRYEPAAELVQVGGDWYDAFVVGDDTVLVIGDVVGHDTIAAAAMGQLRGLVRGIAVQPDASPSRVLTGVDEAMDTLALDTTATAVVLRIEQTDVATGRTRIRWSNAGHPPPVLLEPRGTTRALRAEHADVLLGLNLGQPRAEHEATVEAGSVLVLYSDGLIERRGESVDEGIERLRSTLEEIGPSGASLTQLCDELVGRLSPERPEDDVALVAVRFGR